MEDDAEAAEPETSTQPPEPLPPQQSLVAPPLPLSPPEEFIEDEPEEVVVAESESIDMIGDRRIVVGMEKEMAFEGDNGMTML